ncbi:MAG: metallophosphoesterase [Clostridia bacterium]|nr:metallophosphoesterase [Clostridia bacterium]
MNDNQMTAEDKILLYDPAVFMVGHDYQIIFLTAAKGLGWIEINGERFTDEEGGLLLYDTVHKIPVDGETLNRAGKYTVVFVEYKDKKPYYPEGVEKVRKEYEFVPLTGENFRLFQFADTHARVETPLALYAQTGGCDAVILNGDINEHSYEIRNFHTSFALAEGAVHGTRPVIYSRGNHDTRGYAAQELVNYIPTAFRDGRRETFYSFRQGSLWGLVLDCGEDKYDQNVEYGGTIYFDAFRKRQTAYIKSLIADKANEYEADGVKHKIAVCHIPFTEHFRHPFDVADDIYEEWTVLLGEIGIDLLLCGHMHRAYFVQPHTPTERFRDTAFPVCVASIPEVKREDGTKYYVGGMIEVKDGVRKAVILPSGDEMEF